jgi:transposase InsO family protein
MTLSLWHVDAIIGWGRPSHCLLFNREIVGWSIKPRMATEIVTDALTMAWFHRSCADSDSQRRSRALGETRREFAVAQRPT